MRYYICGQIGDGLDPATAFRPEIVDELPAGTSWAANQEYASLLPEPLALPRFIVSVGSDDLTLHAELAYSDTNPNGFDWIEVLGDGTVVVHAA